MLSKHRNHPLCLCTKCVVTHETQYLKEPNPKFPDCDDCYLQWNNVIADYVSHFCELHQESIVPTPSKRKADVNTEYAFTLTMPPDYQPKKPIEEAAKLILEHGLVSKTKEKAIEWAFVKEFTKAGTPHIHGVYRTPSGRRIERKYFERYWPLWDEKHPFPGNQGFPGGYHAVARHSESYKAYMEKEGVIQKNPPLSQDLKPPHSDALPEEADKISHT